MFRWLIVALLPLSLAQAGELNLPNTFTQGDIIIGQAIPGTELVLDGKAVRVSDEGAFVFGFGRDAPASARLEIIFPDGRREIRNLTVQARRYDVQRIDGLPPSKVTPPKKVLERISRESKQVAQARAKDFARPYFLSGFIWPTKGRISGVYGSQRILNGEPRRPHYGVDVAAPVGTPVHAPADGIVTLTHPNMYFSGGTVIIDHGHGLSSSFLHLEKIHAKEGQAVKQGDVIATVGATGRVTGAHLDWRMNWFKERVDPTVLVPPMP
ncbi:MAG: M23 family metallopeptidase [Candidatus Competibacteraceae bacterium]|jgi:murein DD-endopeptidase MepM/ murein hydrolase activator NlpD|nr:M23 family metallopeptidase [Candidatus Competibacteraceae bacterium]